MPLQEARVRAFELSAVRKRAARFVYEPLHALEIIDLPRDQDFQIVGEADQSAIEHPMRRT
jgi:hypothetical protein